jgi:multiple sugar transport system substrate-binding protein
VVLTVKNVILRRKQMKKLITLAVLLAVLLSGFSFTAQAQQDDWWKEAAAPYAGVTIKGISESTPPSNYARDVLGPQFQ